METSEKSHACATIVGPDGIGVGYPKVVYPQKAEYAASNVGTMGTFGLNNDCIHLTPSPFKKVTMTNNTVQVSSQLLSSPDVTMQKTSYIGSPFNKDMRGSVLNCTDTVSLRSPNLSFAEQKTPKTTSSDKNNKGLRHFSMKVLQKVQNKGVTTYNEVADELVKEFGSKAAAYNDQSYDHKNIRRRVYDALNVLMAMNIITKEKKEIRWVGLPVNSIQEHQHLEDKRSELIHSLKSKLKTIRTMIVQQICLKKLISYNQSRLQAPTAVPHPFRMELPFAVLTTNSKGSVDCAVSPAKDDYYFSFQYPFEINDDFELLRRLGLSNNLENGMCSLEDIDNSKALVPRALQPYVEAIGCCSDTEFEDFILSHKHHLDTDPVNAQTQTLSNSFFINKLVESCLKKRSNKQITPDCDIGSSSVFDFNISKHFKSNVVSSDHRDSL